MAVAQESLQQLHTAGEEQERGGHRGGHRDR